MLRCKRNTEIEMIVLHMFLTFKCWLSVTIALLLAEWPVEHYGLLQRIFVCVASVQQCVIVFCFCIVHIPGLD